jgi:hypothetical protein
LAGGVAGAVPYQSGSGATGFSAAGTSGQVLTSAGASVPTWTSQSSLAAGTATTATNLAGGSNGTIPYQSAAGTTQMLAVGSSGQVLQTNGVGAPSWVTPASNLVLISTTTASSATTASIAIGVNAGTYSQYRIVCSNFLTSNSAVIPALRVGTPTTITTGYNSGGFSPNTTNQYVNRQNTSYFYLTDQAVGTVLSGSLIIDITQAPSGQYGVGIFASTTFDYGSDGVGMSTSNFVGGIGLNGSADLSIIITDRSGTGATNWLSGTFKLYGIKA